jgi:hypothetical protein
MSNINNQSQDLYGIAGVEDLSHENAAACSGGTAILFTGGEYDQPIATLTGGESADLGLLGGLANRASSILINEGVWTFWTRTNFRGDKITLGPGAYTLRGTTFDNDIDSYRRIA